MACEPLRQLRLGLPATAARVPAWAALNWDSATSRADWLTNRLWQTGLWCGVVGLGIGQLGHRTAPPGPGPADTGLGHPVVNEGQHPAPHAPGRPP